MPFDPPAGFDPETPVPQPKKFAPPADFDAGEPIAAQKPTQVPHPGDDAGLVQQSYMGKALDAFGQGASRGWGAEELASSLDPLFGPRGTKMASGAEAEGPLAVFKGFNEGVIRPVFGVIAGGVRGANALWNGFGDAAIALGLPRDIVALPEAFMGSVTNPLGRAGMSPSEYNAALKTAAKLDPRDVTLRAAQELQVIGPDAKPMTEGTPAEAAARLTNTERPAPVAAAQDQQLVKTENPAVDKAGNIRLDLIETSDDAKTVIRTAATANDEFWPARNGQIPLGQQDALSKVLGIPVEQLDITGIGRRLQNDGTVRTSVTALIQSAEDVSNLGKLAARSGEDADLINLQEAIMRHNVIQEQVAGLTAEWGRTGNVFQEFREKVSDAKSLGEFLQEKKGRTLEDLKGIANAMDNLDPRTQLPQFLSDMRNPGNWDKFVYYWINGLLSGPFTHTKYILANTVFAAWDAAVITPTAGVIGLGRKLLTGQEAERVMLGEGGARLYGYMAGTPDAFVAAWEAVKNGVATQLPREVTQQVNPFTGMKAPPFNEGGAVEKLIGKSTTSVINKAVGLPSDIAGAIHTFYRFLGYRGELEAQAYREAAKGGYGLRDPRFWERRGSYAEFPTEAAMDQAIEAGNRTTFTEPLSPAWSKVRLALHATKIGKLIVPFMHIPVNIFKGAQEGTPLAFLDREMAANLRGENGAIARDTQWARLVAGSAATSMFVGWTLNDRMTGDGPTNPIANAQWRLTHAPNSVRIGDKWISFDKFGSLGPLMANAANLAEFGHAMAEGEYESGARDLIFSTMKIMNDETGMQGIVDVVKAVTDTSGKAGSRYMVNEASTLVPYSSGISQTASMLDPHQRQVKTMLDAVKNRIPGERETLFPVRDWMGRPVANDREGWGAFIKNRAINSDPVNLEAQTLGLNPTKPHDSIGGVKLTDKQYDEYQTLAGALTYPTLNAMVSQPGWHDLPAYSREQMFMSTIHAARKQAEAAMQGAYAGHEDDLIKQGIEAKVRQIQGDKKR